jgi:hypothetical protein
MERVKETRWIVLCSDGRHTTIGRDRDPDEDDISRASAALVAAGLSGWLAVMKGGYYVRARPELLMVRPLAGDPADWEGAARAFEATRQGAIKPGA